MTQSMPQSKPKKASKRIVDQEWLIKPNATLTIEQGQDTRLPCTVLNPPNFVAWYKDNGKTIYQHMNRTHIPGHPRFHYGGDKSKGENYLEIEKVELGDEGLYECVSEQFEDDKILVRELSATTALRVLPRNPQITNSAPSTLPLALSSLTSLTAGIASTAFSVSNQNNKSLSKSRLAIAGQSSSAAGYSNNQRYLSAASSTYAPNSTPVALKPWLFFSMITILVLLLIVNCYLFCSLLRRKLRPRKLAQGSSLTDIQSQQTTSSVDQ